jgi:hypothetical protein
MLPIPAAGVPICTMGEPKDWFAILQHEHRRV